MNLKTLVVSAAVALAFTGQVMACETHITYWYGWLYGGQGDYFQGRIKPSADCTRLTLEDELKKVKQEFIADGVFRPNLAGANCNLLVSVMGFRDKPNLGCEIALEFDGRTAIFKTRFSSSTVNHLRITKLVFESGMTISEEVYWADQKFSPDESPIATARNRLIRGD
jgi:hypothetical protein